MGGVRVAALPFGLLVGWNRRREANRSHPPPEAGRPTKTAPCRRPGLASLAPHLVANGCDGQFALGLGSCVVGPCFAGQDRLSLRRLVVVAMSTRGTRLLSNVSAERLRRHSFR